MDHFQYSRSVPLLSYRDENQPTFHDAPPMERGYGSRSSAGSSGSHYSLGSILGHSYGSSPGSSYCHSYGSSSDDYMTPRCASPHSYQTQSYSASPVIEGPNQGFLHVNQDLPPFDPEKEGDPRIGWQMYYDFMVNKTEAFWKLKQGYVVSKTYPVRQKSDPITVKSSDPKKKFERRHPCRILECKANPFTRHYDLERHFRTVHGKKATDSANNAKEEVYHCDYPKCPHEEALRKDHCREHYREFHMEDVVKRGARPGNAETESWWNRRNISKSWWRCIRCLHKNKTADGWRCKKCNQQCEQERQAVRKRLVVESATDDLNSSFSTAFSDPAGSYVSPNCFACENTGWMLVEGTASYEKCQSCQPEFNSMSYSV